jgi:hypothetical protein
MKKINQTAAGFLLLIALLPLTSLQAQTASKAEFEKAIIAEFCDSFSKKLPTMNRENMTTEMGMVILPLFTRYGTQIESEWGLSTSKTTDYRSIGEKIGQLAAINCPSFQEYVKANLNEIVSSQSGSGPRTFSGKLLRMEGKPFAYLLVQNSQGRTDKFYWMEFFPGADKLQASLATYLNKPLRITYKEMEVYQAAEKEYRAVKVITKIDF